MPVVLDASNYGSKWIQWWTESQPQSRNIQTWPFPKEPIDDTSWWKFPAHGRYGLFLAVMAISWWAPAVKLVDDVTSFEGAVEDLHWVIRELIRTRSGDDPPPQPLPPPQPEPASHLAQHGYQEPPPLLEPVALPSSDPPPASSHPSPSPSHLPSPSRLAPPSSLNPTPSSSGAYPWKRAEGKRVVRPSKKLLENLA